MSRSSSHRFASLLTVLSCALLVIGSFFPFSTSTFQGQDPSVLSWAAIISKYLNNPFINNTAIIPTPDQGDEMITLNFMMLTIGLMALSSLLIPSIAALANLFSQRLVFPILGLIFAGLGLLPFGILSLGILSGFCPPNSTDPADCITNTPGPGFWLVGGGFTLTSTCFIVLVVLFSKKHTRDERLEDRKSTRLN